MEMRCRLVAGSKTLLMRAEERTSAEYKGQGLKKVV